MIRIVSLQGRSQDLAGGPIIIFCQVWKFDMAMPCALLGGFEGMPPPRIFFKMMQCGAFLCTFWSDLVFKKVKKLPFFI